MCGSAYCDKMRVVESFEIGRGLVIAVKDSTRLPVGKSLQALVTRVDGTTVSAVAYKEWLLRRNPRPVEGEAFLLRNLRKADVPLGSDIMLKLAPAPLAKAHSHNVATRFRALGWTLIREFRADGDDEPYEYLFEWQGKSEPVYPSYPVKPLAED